MNLESMITTAFIIQSIIITLAYVAGRGKSGK